MTTSLEREDVREKYREVHEKCLYPAVRVVTGKALGSGTIFYVGESLEEPEDMVDVFILTNYHVVANEIEFEKRWNNVLKKDVKTAILGHPQVETFTYARLNSVEGRTSYTTDIVAFDKNQDMALLRLRAPKVREREFFTARVIPPENAKNLVSWMPVTTVGCGLGQEPSITHGAISSFGVDIENEEYWMVSAASIFGNSGGSCFLDETHEMIGIPSRISVSGFQAVEHMGYIITPERIHGFFEDQHYDFIVNPEKTPKECAEEREKLRKEGLLKQLKEEEEE